MAVRGINKVILAGRLGKDPEVRYIPNGGAVANLQVATSESWRDKQTGEMREQTEWHRVVLFGKPDVRVIRNLITESEVAVKDNTKFRFVGADAFSPDELRTDLFSDDEGG